MRPEDVLKRLDTLVTTPSESDAYEEWLKMADAIGFLADNAHDDDLVVFASCANTFLHSIVVPAARVRRPDVQDLLSWNCDPSDSWGIVQSFSPPRVWLNPPLDNTGSKTLDHGEQLIFRRSFEGRSEGRSYFEVLQKFVHIFGLHFMQDRNAYCRLDRLGDYDDIVQIISVPASSGSFGGTVITFRRTILDQYLALTKTAIVRTFDFTRCRSSQFRGWDQKREPLYRMSPDLSYRYVIEAGHASYARGYQVLRPMRPRSALLRELTDGDKEERFASFLAVDWKNKRLAEISCTPGATADYFTESDLPYEVSPAFFRPEVLLKYKADSEKYSLEDRSISCRGAWYLKTYDVNEAGQVHTYVCYLRHLPYQEQLHWKAYNEAPKAPISNRAFKTDFQGSWDEDYDPLLSLKQLIGDLHKVPWWTLRDEKLVEKVHYPVTTSVDEWADEILNLDQLLIEGFEEKWLRQKAVDLAQSPKIQWRSLKLLEVCLVGLGFDADHARQIVEPLREVHDLRSKFKGHAVGQEGREIKGRIRERHRDYRTHFRALCQRCDESLRTVLEALEPKR